MSTNWNYVCTINDYDIYWNDTVYIAVKAGQEPSEGSADYSSECEEGVVLYAMTRRIKSNV